MDTPRTKSISPDSTSEASQKRVCKKLIIVSGGGINPDGALYESSKANVFRGLEVFRRDESQVAIFTSRWNYFLRPKPPITEAEAMKAFALKLGMHLSRTVVEDQSYDTVGNAYYTNKIIVQDMPNVRSITLVTSTWHMPKARFIYNKMFGGNRFKLVFEEATMWMAPEEEEKMKAEEAKKIKVLEDIYGHLSDGDSEGFTRLIERVHPFYAVDKNTIPPEVWARIKATVPTLTNIR